MNRQYQKWKNSDFVYASSDAGHRLSYNTFLSETFGLSPICEAPNFRTFLKLFKANKLLFSTFDDNIFLGVLVAFSRALFGRSTVGLLLRANSCFAPSGVAWGNRFRCWVKRNWYSSLNKLRYVKLISVVQPETDKRLYEITDHFAVDPQFWDMHDGTKLRQPKNSPLQKLICEAAKGRKIICISGTLTTLKGYRFFADIISENPELNKKIFAVAAGKSLRDALETNLKFTAAGGMLIDRHLSDDEIESIYLESDMIWSCYAPAYDYSSGIFGRAIQFCVPTIIRKDSYLDKFSRLAGLSALALEFGNTKDASSKIEALSKSLAKIPNQFEHREKLVGEWRKQFIMLINAGLRSSVHQS